MSSRSSNAKLASLQAFAVQLKGLRERISCNATQPTSLPRSLFGSSDADTLLSEDRMHEGSSERTRSLSAPSRPPPRPPIRANETVCCLHRASPEFNSMASISCSKSLNYEDANRDQRSTSRDVNLIYELHVLRGECERQRKLLDEYENLEEVRDAWKDRERLRAEMELLQRTKAHLEDALLGKDMELLQCNNEFVSYRQKMNFQVFDLTATNQKYSVYLSYEKALLGLVHEHWAESIKIRSHDISRLRSKSSKACQCDENTSVDIMNQLQSVCIQLQKALTVKEKDIEVLKNKLIDVNTRHQKRASRLIVLEREHQALNDAFETVRSKCEENVLRAREEVTFLKSENAMLKRKLNEWEAIDNVHEELRLLLSATDEENRTLKQKLLLLHHQKESG